MKINYQRTCPCFLAKYGGLTIYYIDFEKIYSIDDEDITFLKGQGYALIGNPDHQDVNSPDHEYFFIYDDLFYRTLETDENLDIILRVIHKGASFQSINDNGTDSISKPKSRPEIVSPRHQLQRKRQKNFMIIHRNTLKISS